MEYKLKSSKSGDWITEYCVVGVLYDLKEAPTYLCQWTESLSTAKATMMRTINNLKKRAEYNKDFAEGEADTIDERVRTFRIIKRNRLVSKVTNEEFVEE